MTKLMYQGIEVSKLEFLGNYPDGTSICLFKPVEPQPYYFFPEEDRAIVAPASELYFE